MTKEVTLDDEIWFALVQHDAREPRGILMVTPGTEVPDMMLECSKPDCDWRFMGSSRAECLDSWARHLTVAVVDLLQRRDVLPKTHGWDMRDEGGRL